MKRCHFCQAENSEDAVVCVRCGLALDMGALPLQGDFELRLPGKKDGVVLHALNDEGYTLGRADHEVEYQPDIDLAPFGARESGVSRRHAALVRYGSGEQVFLLDLNSVNGTFVNDQKLEPDDPHPLAFGDHIRLGALILTIAPVRNLL